MFRTIRYISPIVIFLLCINVVWAKQSTLKRDSTVAITAELDNMPQIIEIKASPVKYRQTRGMSRPSWGVEWFDTDSAQCRLSLRWGNTDFGTIDDVRFLRVELVRNGETLWSEDISEGVALHKGDNTLKMVIDNDALLRWNIGATTLAAAGTFPLETPAINNSFRLYARGSDINYSFTTSPSQYSLATRIVGPQTPEDVPTPESFESSPEGVWIYLDRDNDPKWARPGGRYVLGIIASHADTQQWDIIYLDGAVTSANQWKPGMFKGRLIATPFVRHYNLEWVDAQFETMDATHECSASISDDGAILTLNFPLDHSTLRFYRKM